MSRFKRPGLLIVLVLILSTPRSTKALAAPVYGLAFRYLSPQSSLETVRVAFLHADQTWTTATLRQAVYEYVDLDMVGPRWTPDGRTLYVTVTSDDDPRQHRYIYRYDSVTGQYEPLVLLPRSQPEDDWVTISGLSPDGRYLWLTSSLGKYSRLIDTQAPADKRIVSAGDQCYARVLRWTSDYLVINRFFCDGARILDGTTGRVLLDFPDALPNQDVAGYESWIQANSNLLLAANAGTPPVGHPDRVVAIDARSGKVETVAQHGYDLRLSPDGTFAAFVSGQSLMRLNLATLHVEDTGPAADLSSVSAPGDNRLLSWTADYADPRPYHHLTTGS